jgi:hypothetical protein
MIEFGKVGAGAWQVEEVGLDKEHVLAVADEDGDK